MLEKIADYFRLWLWPFAAVILLAWLGRPEQIPVLMYKAIMVTFAIWLGYWADRNLFGYRLDRDTDRVDMRQGIFHIRRAIVVAAVVLAFCIGL